jgi:anti-anti-sigma factor
MSQGKVLQADRSGVYILKLVGEIRLNSCSSIDTVIDAISKNSNFCSLVVDLSETAYIDSTTLGMLAKLAVKAKEKSRFLPSIVSTNPDITRLLDSMGFECIFLIVDEPLQSGENLQELSPVQLDEHEMHDKVLNAHKVLMDLNENNRDTFRDLVAALEGNDVMAVKAG